MMTSFLLIAIISIPVIAFAEHEIFKNADEANEFVRKWCKANQDSWLNYHDTDTLWSKDDPLWKMVTDDIRFCRNGDCFNGLKEILDGYNESGLTKLMIAKHLNCDVIMYHKHSILLEYIWNIEWNNGNQMIFKELVMIYLNKDGVVSEVHHHHKKEITDQFTECWTNNLPQKEDL